MTNRKILHSTAKRIISDYELRCNKLLEYMRFNPWDSKRTLITKGFRPSIVTLNYSKFISILKEEAHL